MIDAVPNTAADTDGRRSRRAAATAADAAIAHTAAFERSAHDSMSPPIVEEQAALLRIYEQAALQNSYLTEVTANGALPPPVTAKRKAVGTPGSPETAVNNSKKGRNGFVEAAVPASLGTEQAAFALPPANGNSAEPSPAGGGGTGERSRRATKPSVRLNEIDHQPKRRQTRPYAAGYNAIAHRPVSSPKLPLPAGAAGAAGYPGPGGTKPASFGRNPDRPESLEDAGADIPTLIEMAAACRDVLEVEDGIDQRLPAYKGNNIHARLLRLAFSALRLGAFTMRKPSVALMAKKLWLLAGQFGKEAAEEAAKTVGQEHLPLHLQPFGATDATPVGGLAGIDPVLDKYFQDVYMPGVRGIGEPGTMRGSGHGTYANGGGTAAGGSGGGSRGPYRTHNFVPPVVDLSAYDEGFVKLAELGRAILGMRRGAPAKLQQILKTQLLTGKKILYKTKTTGRIVHVGVITEKGGITCHCNACKGAVEVTPTDFEIHAGSSDRRPADSIYLEEYPDHSLRDLLNVMMSDAAAAADVHMDHCMACKLGGDLLCCDGCTSAYHLACASLSNVPTGQWHCEVCVAEAQNRALYSSRAGGGSGATRGRGRGGGRRGRPPADGGRGGATSRGRGRGRGSRGGFGAFGLGGFAGGGAGGRVHMIAPSAMRRNANRPTRNLNRNKRLFEADEGGLQNGEPLHYMNRGSVVLSGTAVLNPSGQSGILCSCCKKVLSCSQFESHAGHSQRRQPYECIFTDDGRNLKAIAAALPTPEADEAGNVGIDEEDEGTGVEPGPGSGGCVLCYDPEFQRDFGPRTMMLCDQCEREFHVGCMSAAGMATLEGLPEGDWFCTTGCGKIHGILRKHVAAGQIPVVFSSEDGQPRSQLPGFEPVNIQQVAMPGLPSAERVAEAAESAAIAAMQAAAAAVAAVDSLAEGDEKDVKGEHTAAVLAYADATAEAPLSAAGLDIGALAAAAGNAAAGAAAAGVPAAKPFLLPSLPSTSSFGASLQNAGYTWQVLNGKDGRAGTAHAIKAAAEILQESFDPIIDLSTNTDLLPLMLYAQQYGDWDYRGVYTLLLRYKGKPVVAATSRVFGPQYAELPLIATRSTARRQGHARVLVSLFLNLLSEAGVHQLVLPAAHETVETWKNGFNFIDMPEEEVAMAKQQLRILVFPGTEVLWKVVENTVPADGHHVLHPVPPPEDILGVRHAIQDLVTAVAVAAGEEAPKIIAPVAVVAAPPAVVVDVARGVEAAVTKGVLPSKEAVVAAIEEDIAAAAATLSNGGSYESLMEQAMVAGAAAVDKIDGATKAEILEAMNIDQ
jgi:Tify domain binding domain